MPLSLNRRDFMRCASAFTAMTTLPAFAVRAAQPALDLTIDTLGTQFIYKLILPLLALWVALVMTPLSASAASITADSFIDHRAHLAIAEQPCYDTDSQTCVHPASGCVLFCSGLSAGALLDVPALSLQVPGLIDAAPRPNLSLSRAGLSLLPEPFPPRFASSL